MPFSLPSLLFVVALAYLSPVTCQDGAAIERQVNMTYNPGCSLDVCMNGNINLVYVRAAGPHDILHYVWSTIGAPSVLVSRGALDSQLQMDWTKVQAANLSGFLSFTGETYHSFGVSLTQLISYSDDGDQANLEQAWRNQTKSYPLDEFEWEDFRNTSHDLLASNQGIFVARSSPDSLLLNHLNGSLSIKLTIPGKDMRADYLPHLQNTENTTMVDVTLNNLFSNLSSARFAVEALVAESDSTQSLLLVSSKSIDDEYTPGVFGMSEVRTDTLGVLVGGFVQWKPVCYLSDDRNMANATMVKSSVLQESSPQRSVLQALVNEGVPVLTTFKAFNVSFGLRNDGWYLGTNYTAWTFTVGTGAPPLEAVSMLVIAVISAGLGVPVVLIALGCILIVVRKRKGSSDSAETYESINS